MIDKDNTTIIDCQVVCVLMPLMPFDADFQEAMAVYVRGAKKFRNAMRALAR